MKRIICIILTCILCVSVKITDETGTHEEMIGKDAYPYVFYCSSVPSEYIFMDAEGNGLN